MERLQRAQAVPPAQRTPEVAAFVEAMQLDEEVCELLPLRLAPSDADGINFQSALPADEATAQRVLLAIRHLVRIFYICGDIENNLVLCHIWVYQKRGCGPYPPMDQCHTELRALIRRSSGAIAAGTFLWLFAAIDFNPHLQNLEKATALQQLGDALAAADQESFDQQLRQLQGVTATADSNLLITCRQLQWTCCLQAKRRAMQALEEAHGPAEKALALALPLRAAETMIQLEPSNPSSLRAAAKAVERNPNENPLAHCSAMLGKHLQCYNEAKRQRHFQSAVCASSAAVCLAAKLLTSGGGVALGRSTAKAAVEAFHEAEASFQPIKRLLPEVWVKEGTAMAAGARHVLPSVQQFVGKPATAQQRSTAQRSAAAALSTLAEICPPPGMPRCTGCGKRAQGLRKCSRCRRVGYCR